MNKINHKPDYLFEVSWEVCNKIGGVHTVLSSKAKFLTEEFKDNYIVIGPDVWKETHQNPEFIENKNIMRSWREYAEKSGLKFRIGRWNIPSKPIAILVDFTPHIVHKDEILTKFWERYQLDSIAGHWGYIEPVLFGYAAGKIIENYYEFYVNAQENILAHFHQWTSGSGLLYLKDRAPQVGLVYSSHSTTLGEKMISENKDIPYNEELDIEHWTNNYNIRSEFSMEKTSFVEADIACTVSEILKEEAKYLYGRESEVITYNGFDTDFAIGKDRNINRDENREHLLKIAKAITKQNISKDSVFIATSGVERIKTKGFDLFIDSLAKYNNDPKSEKDILAFVIVPTHIVGPREDLNIEEIDFKNPAIEDYLTHWIFDYDTNPIVQKAISSGLKNRPEDKVKIIYIPTYLNGNDGVVNLKYYDFISSVDFTIFPSLYEPWGYTPMESAALGVPSVTSSQSGFGHWIEDNKLNGKGVFVLNRSSKNYEEESQKLYEIINNFTQYKEEDYKKLSQSAIKLGEETSWKNMINKYFQAYSSCIDLSLERFEQYKTKTSICKPTNQFMKQTDAEWRKILVKIDLPESLQPLLELSRNLWWSWNWQAIELFESIDPVAWRKHKQNPNAMFNSLSYDKIQELKNSKDFIEKLNKVYADFNEYMSKSHKTNDEMVAYFSMEFGIHDSLKIYSGGLGVLAGDYLKEASDSNRNIIGVGLLYRYGYFKQEISHNGEQINTYLPQKFSELPLIPVRDKNGEWLKVSIVLPGRNLYAKVWRVDVGRVPLYLLDTDFEDNNDADRAVTASLYGGDWENRLKQEMLLGFGGIRFLKSLGIEPEIYHLNEGHAAFLSLERLKDLIQENNIPYNQAVEIVRSSSLFTTHTPVPAGHDYFTEDLLRVYISHYPERLNISWDTMMNLGKMHEGSNEKFSMSILATKLSQEVNGVSRIHGRVSQEMFSDLYKGYFPEELHIGYVTNGVHYPTWTHKEMQELHKEHLGDKFINDQSNMDIWKKIDKVPSDEIWNIRKKLKSELMDYVKIRLTSDMTKRQESPSLIFNTINSLNENTLTIGFARRFATYKRAKLLFTDLDKLSALVNNPERPIQLIYAGKAHPADKLGQELIQHIIKISRMEQFIGKVIFVENYDIPLAQHLISGCDVWLNTPTRPMEASGTSGEKAVMNGVLNFSVLDGWWGEGYVPGAGWALKEERTYENQDFQNILDAETIYNLLNDEIGPLYYDVNNQGVPENWIKYMKKNFAEIAPRFTMKRQVDDYYDKFYDTLFERARFINKDNYQMASQLAKWKNKMINSWETIEVLDIETPNAEKEPLMLGEDFKAKVKIDLSNLDPEDIGLEIVFAQKEKDMISKIYKKFELEISSFEDGIATFEVEIPSKKVGVYDYIFRLYPKSEMLPHRQDFGLVKWF